VRRNARNETPITKQRDAFHPNISGFMQISDSIYAWMVCRLNTLDKVVPTEEKKP